MKNNNPIDNYLNTLSDRSQVTAINVLSAFSDWLTRTYPDKYVSTKRGLPDIWWRKITYRVVIDYIDYLRTTPKSKSHQTRKQKAGRITAGARETSTVKLYVTIIKSCLRQAYIFKSTKARYRVSEQQLREVEHIKIKHKPTGKYLVSISKSELQKLCSGSHRKSIKDYRNTAIFMLMYYGGLRANEVVTLNYPGSIDFSNRCIFVFGKGGKERIVPLHKSASKALRKWLKIRTYQTGPLFFRIGKKQKVIEEIPDKNLTTHGLSYILRQKCINSDLPPYQTHDFRRTFATTLFERNVDTPTIRELMGHVSTDSTVVYDMRDDYRKYAAVDLI